LSVERLQKILARGGYASRRAAERIIAEGRVRVNGRVVTELGSKADPYKDKVEVNGERVVAEAAVYIVLHKPRGVVTTMSDPEGRPSVREILAPIGTRVYPVGRLDFATSGVLLATNDGDFAEGMMHPKKAVPKTYVVKVAGAMQPKDLDRWREGIRLEDGVTLPAKLKLLRHEGDKTWFELTIREGRNQQIRRMGEASGFPVMRLARLSFAGVTAEGLRPGAWRYLAPDELVDLKKEYGVPRRIVDAEMRPTARTRPRKGPLKAAEPVAAHGRDRRATSGEASERARAGGQPESGASSDARSGARSGPRSRTGESRSRAPSGESRSRSAGESQGRDRAKRGGGQDAPSSDKPRYGGGAPGRRGYDVGRDWGGGAGRGTTGSDRSEPERGGARRGSTSRGGGGEIPRGDVGGRGGHSRTTGSGGGIGAGAGDFRVKGRGGRSR
jgi:23S rRNA pseudouridine2605 synthase